MSAPTGGDNSGEETGRGPSEAAREQEQAPGWLLMAIMVVGLAAALLILVEPVVDSVTGKSGPQTSPVDNAD